MAPAILPRTLRLEPYSAQVLRWPARGQQIIAHFDAESITVYQAYRLGIAEEAVAQRRLGGKAGFSFNRMSWIKPNFLWMMYRSGWATKENQERVLALRVERAGFDALLQHAVHSSYQPDLYADMDYWRRAVRASDVRLQWDPDHAPSGARLERRTLQLGLRGSVLRTYAERLLLDVEDITPFVAAQRDNAGNPGALLLPREDLYPVSPGTAHQLGIRAP
jgi:hypothetical protein